MSDYDTPIRLRRSEAAAYLQSRYRVGSASYLEKLAVDGNGPVFEKIGGLCLYRREDLDHWAYHRVDGRSLRYRRDKQADGVASSTEGGGDA